MYEIHGLLLPDFLFNLVNGWVTYIVEPTGDGLFAEGFWVCRGLDLGHSTKGVFAEGQLQEPSANPGPRQNKSLPRAALGKYGRMGHDGHWRQSLPSARR